MLGTTIMEQWFSSGQIVDVILVLTTMEMLGFILLKHKMRIGTFVGEIVTTLLSGVCLLFALRGALVAASWPYIASGLLASLLFHVLSLRLFWNSSSKQELLKEKSPSFKTPPEVQKNK